MSYCHHCSYVSGWNREYCADCGTRYDVPAPHVKRYPPSPLANRIVGTILVVLIALIVLVCFSKVVHAEEVKPYTYDLVIAGFSAHTNKGFNDINPGVGVKMSKGNIAYDIGEYKNSYRHPTEYAIIEWTPAHYNNIDAGLFGGIVYGYTWEQNKLTPLAAGGIVNAHFTENAGLSFHIVPPACASVGFISVNLLYRIR